jgi:hypothetical protein
MERQMGDLRRARRRRQLAANPELLAAALARPLANARGALALARELAPDVGGLRVAIGVVDELRAAVASLGGHRSPQVREARRLLRELAGYIGRPDGLPMYPHLRCCPRGAKPWPCWQRHLATLARERPELRAGIEQDRQWLKQHEAEETAEREVGEFLPVPVPPKVVALLREASDLAPSLDLKQRIELHRRLQRLLIGGRWEPHPAERVLATLAPPELYGMLPAGSA